MRFLIIISSCFFLSGLLLGGCGSSEEELTPEERMQAVRESEIGKAYDAYPFFARKNWSVMEHPEQGSFVHFAAVYHLPAIFKQTCPQYVQEHGEEAVQDLQRINGMEHRVAFVIEEEEGVKPLVSGWSVTCANGTERRVPDPEFNSVKEVLSGTWSSDCEQMLEIARAACPTQEEAEAMQQQGAGQAAPAPQALEAPQASEVPAEGAGQQQ